MQTVKADTQIKYVVAHDSNGSLVFNTLEQGQEMATSLTYIREHDTEKQLEASVDELAGIKNYYKAHKIGEYYLLAPVNDRYSKPVFDAQDGQELTDAPFDITTHHLYRYDHQREEFVKI